MDNILELELVSKTFPKSNYALDKVSFSIPYGAIMGFVGENGAGKTTTIGCILNTVAKDSGTIKLALQWSDLDIENKTISVSKQAGRNSAGEPDITRPKTENSIRKISIPQDAVDLLIAEHKKHPSNPWMFPSPKTGEMYHPDSVVNIHKKILKDAGLEHLRFHDLRHTFATLALQNGVDVKTVSSMLGHFDAGFTLRTYTHVTRQMQESAAEKMGNFMAQVM